MDKKKTTSLKQSPEQSSAQRAGTRKYDEIISIIEKIEKKVNEAESQSHKASFY